MAEDLQGYGNALFSRSRNSVSPSAIFGSMIAELNSDVGGTMTQPHHAQLPALPLQVDIVSDVVCPWCIVGYKQLMKALASLPGQFDVTIHWHPLS
jgi:hypothetical protein